mmetsp:Transcript_11531/g.20464  ORF Transcript_11531/g.20464 Transcript_11531/m.20464 type:complete len:400 (+) Transcript_11531:186-1385(+)
MHSRPFKRLSWARSSLSRRAPWIATSAFVEAPAHHVLPRSQQLFRAESEASQEDHLLFSLELESDTPAAKQTIWSIEPVHLYSPAAQQVQVAAEKTLGHLASKTALHPAMALAQAATNLVVLLPPSFHVVLRQSAPVRPPGTGANPSWALSHLRHTFIVVTTGEGEELLVEPSLPDHFLLSGASAVYNASLARVPRLFVGSHLAMHRTVAELSAQLAIETAALGRALPPWRNVRANLSKFLPQQWIDVPMLHPAASLLGNNKPSPAASDEHLDFGRASHVGSETDSEASASSLGTSPVSVLPMLAEGSGGGPSKAAQAVPHLVLARHLVSPPASRESVVEQGDVLRPLRVVTGFEVSASKFEAVARAKQSQSLSYVQAIPTFEYLLPQVCSVRLMGMVA